MKRRSFLQWLAALFGTAAASPKLLEFGGYARPLPPVLPGPYEYKTTFVTEQGETLVGPAVTSVTTTARRIYRMAANDKAFHFVGEMPGGWDPLTDEELVRRPRL